MSFRLRSQLVPDIHDTITIAAGSFSNTKTHANKIFANCRLRIIGWRDNNDGSGRIPYISLSQSGSDVVVTANVLGANTSDIIIAYAIEEYVGHVIKSIQRFTLQATSGVAVTIPVTQVGAFWSLTQLGVATTDNVTGNMSNWTMIGTYDGVTTVTGTPGQNASGAAIRASFELVEWY